MLKIYKDRVVIEGHEQTKEQCETMTLLANALKDSKDFKVVDYKNGYAEFEKVGKSNELKFLPGVKSFYIITSDGTQVCFISADGDCALSFTGKVLTITSGSASVQTANSEYVDTYTTDSLISIAITMKQDISSLSSTTTSGNNITITFSSASSSMKSVDLTTLGGWNDLADGTHNITIVAKGTGYQDSDASDSVQVTKSTSSGETWVLNETLTTNYVYAYNDTDILSSANNYKINLSINNINYYGLCLTIPTSGINAYTVYNKGEWGTGSDGYELLKTWVFATAPTGDLLTWLQSNGTKQ